VRFTRLSISVLPLFLAAATACAQTDVRLLTYNIHRDIGGSDSTTSSQPALAKVINYLKPDVWTINELGGNSVTFNAATAHNYLVTFIQQKLTVFGANPQENVNFYIYISTIDDSFDTVAIVSRYPFASTQTYSDGSSSFSALRGLPRASVSLPDGNVIDVFTAHLKALSTTSDASQRQSEADADSASVATWISGHHGDAIAVTGDWNETEDPGETANWSGHSIGDVLRRPREPYQPITTMKGAGLLDPKPLSIAGRWDTIDSSTPDARFDYTMYTGSRWLAGQVFDTKQYTSAQLSALNSAAGTSFVAGDSASASDHLPVFSILRVGIKPQITSLAAGSGTIAIIYQSLLSPFVTYSIEQSTDLANWTPVAATNQTLSQTADTRTVQSTVNASTSPLFFHVRATVN
jgi:endonuclease/exonuclease/phosphatase family metal-dependent hydrolase